MIAWRKSWLRASPVPCAETRRGVIATSRLASRAAFGGFALLLLTANAFAAEPACPPGLPMHLNLPVTRAAIARDLPITVVALGSSSTEGAGASAPDRTYPARLQTLLGASWPDLNVTVLNRGIGGQLVDSVLPRIDADVVVAHPTLVIWQVGTNEALRAMDPGQFDSMVDEGLRRLATVGSDIVLMDYQIAPHMPPEAQRDVYRDIIAKEAKAHGVPLFSRAALMQAWAAADPTATDMIGADGLHHSDRGYACLAASLDLAIVSGAAPKVAAVSVTSK
jgi:lysophospholipase L1-like esterase